MGQSSSQIDQLQPSQPPGRMAPPPRPARKRKARSPAQNSTASAQLAGDLEVALSQEPQPPPKKTKRKTKKRPTQPALQPEMDEEHEALSDVIMDDVTPEEEPKVTKKKRKPKQLQEEKDFKAAVKQRKETQKRLKRQEMEEIVASGKGEWAERAGGKTGVRMFKPAEISGAQPTGSQKEELAALRASIDLLKNEVDVSKVKEDLAKGKAEDAREAHDKGEYELWKASLEAEIETEESGDDAEPEKEAAGDQAPEEMEDDDDANPQTTADDEEGAEDVEVSPIARPKKRRRRSSKADNPPTPETEERPRKRKKKSTRVSAEPEVEESTEVIETQRADSAHQEAGAEDSEDGSIPSVLTSYPTAEEFDEWLARENTADLEHDPNDLGLSEPESPAAPTPSPAQRVVPVSQKRKREPKAKAKPKPKEASEPAKASEPKAKSKSKRKPKAQQESKPEGSEYEDEEPQKAPAQINSTEELRPGWLETVPTRKSGPFLPEEVEIADRIFKDIVEQHNFSEVLLRNLIQDWRNAGYFKVVINAAFPNRNKAAIRKFCQRRYSNYERGPWTEEQDQMLRDAYANWPNKWTQISERVDRSAADCKDRWTGSLQKTSLGPWPQAEEDMLLNAVEECIASIKEEKSEDTDLLQDREALEELINWGVVAQKMGQCRNARQCRDKYKKINVRQQRPEPTPKKERKNKKGHAHKGARDRESDAAKVLDKFEIGDYYDVFVEIHKSFSDHSAHYHNPHAVIWSIVAMKNPASRFSAFYFGAALRRAALNKAAEEWPQGDKKVKRKLDKAETVPAKALVLAQWIEKRAKGNTEGLPRTYLPDLIGKTKEEIAEAKKYNKRAKGELGLSKENVEDSDGEDEDEEEKENVSPETRRPKRAARRSYQEKAEEEEEEEEAESSSENEEEAQEDNDQQQSESEEEDEDAAEEDNQDPDNNDPEIAESDKESEASEEEDVASNQDGASALLDQEAEEASDDDEDEEIDAETEISEEDDPDSIPPTKNNPIQAHTTAADDSDSDTSSSDGALTMTSVNTTRINGRAAELSPMDFAARCAEVGRRQHAEWTAANNGSRS